MERKDFFMGNKNSHPALKTTESFDEHIKGVAEFYTKAFEHIRQLPSFHTGYEYSTKRLEALGAKHGFPDVGNVLELCSGIGSGMIYLAKKYGFLIDGIDLNEKQIAESKKRIAENGLSDTVSSQVGNVLNLPKIIKNKRYGAIWSEDAFSHIPERNLLLKNCTDALKPEGLLLFYDLVKTAKASEEELKTFYESWRLWSLESIDSYKSILTQYFDILEAVHDTGKELINEHNKGNKKLDFKYEFHPDYLTSHKEELVKKMGEQKYQAAVDRAKMYSLLENDKLDYTFFICRKKV